MVKLRIKILNYVINQQMVIFKFRACKHKDGQNPLNNCLTDAHSQWISQLMTMHMPPISVPNGAFGCFCVISPETLEHTASRRQPQTAADACCGRASLSSRSFVLPRPIASLSSKFMTGSSLSFILLNRNLNSAEVARQ